MMAEKSSYNLNLRAARLVARLDRTAEDLRVARHRLSCGATCWDFGLESDGGIEAGLYLARICLADLARVRLTLPAESPWPLIHVATDHPLAACMASQYAGWRISRGDYFAMGSGPMRAAAGVEELFDRLALRESAKIAIGVLEASRLPGDDVARQIATACGIDAGNLHLLVAPTHSFAGTIQIVARSVETALHKMLELGYDLCRVQNAMGVAPLPPLVGQDMAAIGRTNDAILYGANVQLWIDDGDAQLAQLSQQVPSAASKDFGEPFAEIFARYDHDFYRIDPLLFSPARVSLQNVRTGKVFAGGSVRTDILHASFGTVAEPTHPLGNGDDGATASEAAADA